MALCSQSACPCGSRPGHRPSTCVPISRWGVYVRHPRSASHRGTWTGAAKCKQQWQIWCATAASLAAPNDAEAAKSAAPPADLTMTATDPEQAPVTLPSARRDALPKAEVKRLVTEGLKITTPIKLGRKGVWEDLVFQIRNRWRTSEVVRLYCHGKHAANMRVVAEQLEKQSGGIIVQRAGGTILLYRGPGYIPDRPLS